MNKSSPLAINAEQLHERLEVLRSINGVGTGVKSLALTPENKQARDHIMTWMSDAGLTVVVDEIGNIIAMREGKNNDLPPVLVGSHIDTVDTGGKFDGRLGVLAGLSALEAMDAANVETEHPMAVAVFTAEEGARFQPAMVGSAVFTGKMTAQDAWAINSFVDGTNLKDELAGIGYLGKNGAGFDVHAFLELHIEQGPMLERQGRALAPVRKVQGISQNKYVIHGETSHAGCTPMELGTAAGYIQGAINKYIYELARETDELLATVGSVLYEPGGINVEPETVTMTVDLRSPNTEVLREAQAKVDTKMQALIVAETTRLRAEYEEYGMDVPHVACEITPLQRLAPRDFDPQVIDAIAQGMQDAGVDNVQPMVLGAGHDACNMAESGIPTAMIAVQSVGGISHNLAEYTKPEHVEASANTLANAMLAMDKMKFVQQGQKADSFFDTEASDGKRAGGVVL